jgi:hypothetical protein
LHSCIAAILLFFVALQPFRQFIGACWFQNLTPFVVISCYNLAITSQVRFLPGAKAVFSFTTFLCYLPCGSHRSEPETRQAHPEFYFL